MNLARHPVSHQVSVWVGAPDFSRGKPDFSPAAERGVFSFLILAVVIRVHPGAKVLPEAKLAPAALKRSFPRMNAGATTTKWSSD